ncbi:hypothetical protein [Streptomyces uncialis]|uniref:hypothetical protein n=1 Tax=Streptomyces uncialis TaxID=1048205 RepID=UPI0038664E39|nr:hypothetical protein OG268_19765 [Streptomyces uncialis]
MIYQHSNVERRRDVAAGLGARSRPSGRRLLSWLMTSLGDATGSRRLTWSRQQERPGSLTWAFFMERVTRIELAL